MMPGDNRIVIAGAGIGGLVTALGLLRAGFDVQVLEQAGELKEIGAGLQIAANGMKVLQWLGLESELSEVGAAVTEKSIRLWSSGETWKLFDLASESVARYGAPYLMFHRSDLHNVLCRAVEQTRPGTVQLSSRVTSSAQDENGVVVHLADGISVKCSALIGADGVHSATRRDLFGGDSPEFTGMVAWRGTIPANRLPAHLSAPVGVNWVGPGRHVIHYPVRGGELVNFVGIVERDDWQVESWTTQGTKEECAADFEGWHEDVHTLIANIDTPFKWALMGREPMEVWADRRIVLLGDACHPTLPFMAQGAGMAIEDGCVLARCLTEHPLDPALAFALFQDLRVQRTARLVRSSAENGRRFHNPELAEASGAAAYVGREFDPDRVRTRYDWLFKYDATTVPLHSNERGLSGLHDRRHGEKARPAAHPVH